MIELDNKDAAIHYAAVLANDHKGASYIVWHKRERWWIITGPDDHNADGSPHQPDDSELVCISKHFSDETVQLRFPGAGANVGFVNFAERAQSARGPVQ